MAVKARGQITIVDLNDAKLVQLLLDASKGSSQIYNTDTSVSEPDYTSTPNVITPKVFVTGGDGNNQMLTNNVSNSKWYLGDTEITSSSEGFEIDTTTKALSVKKNLTDNMMRLTFKCVYTDPKTALTTNLEAYFDIRKNSTAGAAISLRVETPHGRVFKTNDADTDELLAVPLLYAGSTKLDIGKEGSTARGRVQWQFLNIEESLWNTIYSTSGTNSNMWVDEETGILHINKKAVLNFLSVKCLANDTNGTNNTTDDDTEIEEIVTFEDKSDPYELKVRSTTGDKIVNGAGSTTVFAEVWQGEEIVCSPDVNPTKFSFKWYKYADNGNRIDWVDASGVKRNKPTDSSGKNYETGNSVVVNAKDVNVRCTIWCDMEQS